MTMAYLMEWLQLFFRWFHVIAGIAWIGASFYFIWLDNSLREPPQWKKDKGIKGDLWAVHGGGYYEVAKYHLGPEEQPKTLHWFKWEAYTTWLTGMVLMVLIYYVGAQAYLVDASKFAFTTPQAVILSIAALAVGLAIYEGLLRTPLRHNGMAFGLVLFVILTAYAWLMTALFSGRGAYMQVGALIGTIMAANVFLGIIPAQRKMVAAVQAGETPDPAPALMAKLRSTHNNYFTLPIIFIMLSNHYPMTYGHEWNWAVLAAICAISAYARHYFNLKHQGKVQPAILVIALVALAGLAFLMAPPSSTQTAVSEERAAELANVDRTEINSILAVHCAGCHAANPSSPMFSSPPAGMIFENTDHLLAMPDRVITSMRSGYMPLGNMTGMSSDERTLVLDWIAAQR